MISIRVLRPLLFCLALLCCGMNSYGGLSSYTDRGTIDFDTALQLLNPYGTWSKINDVWAYTPLDHETPYTNGRWIYTEYGWYWKGNHRHSWITEHYGFWKRGADKVWSWYPGPVWLSQIIEFRQTPTHIGWRSGEVDRNGDFVESPEDRYAKTDEWTFVTKAQFAAPITPGIVAKPEEARTLLQNANDCMHIYYTYRPIGRPGPHPGDFVAFNKDGGMFSPLQGAVMADAPSEPVLTGRGTMPLVTNEPSATAPMTGTNGPTLAGTGQDADVLKDQRQVKYWVTMSLPTYWTPPPTDSKPEEIYIYRPDFYQDPDGIARRITLWFNPQTHTSLKEVLTENMAHPKANPNVNVPAGPAQPATPAVSAQAHNPFRSPLDSPIPDSNPPPTESSKANATTNSAPSGLASPPPGKVIP